MKVRSFSIPKEIVWAAYKKVKQNKGAAGIDNVSLEDFDRDRKKNLYTIWSRMESGSYFPPPVKMVEIPKKSGGKRALGIPSISDRIAQTVVQMQIEPSLEAIFHRDSYGYRPGKSAHQAVETLKKRCWNKKWVLEFDIKGAFDNIDHELLMKAVNKHVKDKWAIIYIERWLKAPFINAEKELLKRDKGTPQGGVIGPVMMNLFMHYAFDMWINKQYPKTPFVRYADDGVVNCATLKEARALESNLAKRLKECGLEMHPDKTRIVYCQTGKNDKRWKTREFTFLGFTFRPRSAQRKDGLKFTSFQPAVSRESKKRFRQKIRHLNIPRWTNLTIEEIALRIGPFLRGWWNYFEKFYKSELIEIGYFLDLKISKWVRKKYKQFRYKKRASGAWIKRVSKKCSYLFPHWENRWKNVLNH